MIVGENSSKPLDLLEALAHSPHAYYPSGSRYYGGVRADSDWDFFTAWSEAVVKELVDLGFDELYPDHKSHYLDNGTVCVFRAPYKHTHIDVQLVRDIPHRLRAQALVKRLALDWLVPKHNPSTRDRRREMWNRVLKETEE